ncbi:hypothetical protein AB4Z09_24405 [Rhodococcus sp. TAF43]|uniref:hypothetical protein n=1 Tax=Rhodococcus sp. TAF43 TaxID=3237483 RepID=UPI003F9813F7
MLVGVIAALLGVVLNTVGALLSARDSRGQRSTGPSQRVRRFHSAGWIASIVGALAIGDAFWNSTPGVSIGVAVLILANGLPSLAVTLVNPRRVAHS